MPKRIDNVIEAKGVLILGAGVAGLFAALKLAPFPALVLAGTRPGVSGSSAWAQGGIAAAMDPTDSWRFHAEDTLAAGAGICDVEVAEFVAREAQARIEDLISYGAPFDRKPDGTLALGREAAHSANRIVHVKGDRAGAEVTRTLAERALATSSIKLLEGFHALELAMESGRVTGLFARYGVGQHARLILFRAPAIIFATGGLGALYAVTTNPLEARGEGLGMAARAGALIADPEFVQFHPTAIAIGRDPAPLATEALRGEGAILVDEKGTRFMPAIHRDAELAPRDVVARAIHREIAAGHKVVPRLSRSVRRKLRLPLSDGLCRLQIRRHRARARTHSGRTCRPLSYGRHRNRRPRAFHPRGFVGRGRMRIYRPAWRQPLGFQFLARSPRFWRARSERCAQHHRAR